MTPHIESKKEDIAELVLMPGDPLRAKYIAENFLENVKVVNNLRNMTAYTGTYKGKKLTIFPSGMGIPSIGIYAYELYRFYDVKKIIRIGTCGTFNKDIEIGDVVLATSATSVSSYNEFMTKDSDEAKKATFALNEQIEKTAGDLNIWLKEGPIITSDVFDLYVDFDNFVSIHEKKPYVAVEMEAFGLFTLAQKFEREASCLLTVVDSHHSKKSIPAEERERSLNEMIKLALEAITR